MNSYPVVPYARHSLDILDVQSVVEVLKSEWLTTGPTIANFERKLEEYLSIKSVVVSSGTAALHSVFASLNIKAGDEIITTPNTFVATQATAILAGATIKFADVQEDTGNIDTNAVKSLITNRTKAIVAVDFAGHPADIDELMSMTHGSDLKLVEDAAHSLGSTYKGRLVGSLAHVTTFSFFATKNISTGEGGAVTALSPALLQKIRRFARQGVNRDFDPNFLDQVGPWYYEVEEFGLNYRLPDVLCALGISQLQKIEMFKAFRKSLFERYCDVLASFSFVNLPVQRNYVDPMWHLFPMRVPSSIRKELFKDFHKAGINVQVNYIPSYWHPAFDKNQYPRGLCPVAEKFYLEEISLPFYVNSYLMTDEYFSRLTSVLTKYV